MKIQAWDSADGNTLLVVYPDKEFRRTPSEYTFPRNFGLSGKYDPLIYWSQSDPLPEILSHLRTIREFVEEEIADPYLREQYEPLSQKLKAIKYIFLLDGAYTEAKLFPNKELGKTQYIPGLFSGNCFGFKRKDGNFLGRIPISAANSNQIYYDLNKSPLLKLKRDLRDKAREAAHTAIKDVGTPTITEQPPSKK